MKKELKRNAKIMELYRHTTLTLEEIGKIWGITKQRVKGIIEKEQVGKKENYANNNQ